MWVSIVSDLITGTGRQDKFSPIRQFSFKLALKNQKYVTLAAPVIGEITWSVFNHPHTQAAKLARTPVSHSRFTGMLAGFDLTPVGGAKGDI